MSSPEKRLFNALIVRAVMDARGHTIGCEGGEKKLAQMQALNWFKGNGRDFRIICELAGIDAGSVRAAVLSGRVDDKHLDNRCAEKNSKAKRSLAR